MLIHFFARPFFPVDVAGHAACWAALLFFPVLFTEVLSVFQRIFPVIVPAVISARLSAMFVRNINEFALECANER